MSSNRRKTTAFPEEQALPSLQFVLHLRDCQGPIGRLLNISTGLCTFNGPVYMFPVPKETFSIYTGFLDSICEDIIFVAFIYNDRTPNTIEGEIRLYNVLSQDDEISFEPMNTNQLQMTMTFNRRALFRCVFWSKLREATENEVVEKTKWYADMEYRRMVETFAGYKRKQLQLLRPGYVRGLWKKFFNYGNFLRSDGIFLKITQHNSKEENAFFPLNLSISALRIEGNAVSVAFITLPQNVGLMRFLERFCSHSVRNMVGEFDNVLGVCQGQAMKKNYQSSFGSSLQRFCQGNVEHRHANNYRVRLHTKWHTTLELEVLAEDHFILHHRVKGIRVMKNEMHFCPVKSDGFLFPEGVVPNEYLPQEYERTSLNGAPAVFARFPKIKKQQKIANIPPDKVAEHRKINVARTSSHRILTV